MMMRGTFSRPFATTEVVRVMTNGIRSPIPRVMLMRPLEDISLTLIRRMGGQRCLNGGVRLNALVNVAQEAVSSTAVTVEDFLKSLEEQVGLNSSLKLAAFYAALYTTMQSFSDELAKLRDSLESRLDATADATAVFTSVSQVMCEMEAFLTTQDIGRTSLEEDNVSLKRKITSLEADYVSLKRQITNLKEEIASLKRQIASLKENILEEERKNRQHNALQDRCITLLNNRLEFRDDISTYSEWVSAFHEVIAVRLGYSYGQLTAYLHLEEDFMEEGWKGKRHQLLQEVLDRYKVTATEWEESVDFSRQRNLMFRGPEIKPKTIKKLLPTALKRLEAITALSADKKAMLRSIMLSLPEIYSDPVL